MLDDKILLIIFLALTISNILLPFIYLFGYLIGMIDEFNYIILGATMLNLISGIFFLRDFYKYRKDL